ncbi:MAG: GAF and ANTAR domain-containing protein [Actinoallomurus sp.]
MDGELDGHLERAAKVAADKIEELAARPMDELGKLTTVLLNSSATVDVVLQRVVFAARLIIPGADVVSVTLRRGEGDYYTPVETDAVALALDELQYKYDEGPCVDAADPGGPAYAHSGDLGNEPKWPTFGAKMAEHGYFSILSTALLTRPDPSSFTGALNVYSRDHGALDDHARDVAFLLATYASLAIGAAKDRADADDAQTEAANLHKALETRTVIGQATGILMARRGLSADDAFQVLARASQNHNVKLSQLAKLVSAHPKAADRL